MKEDEGNSQLSMATTENVKSEPPHSQLTLMKKHIVSIILTFAGFYFLTFAMIELITNYSDHNYEGVFSCSSYQCVATLSSTSLSASSNVYFYLTNSKITQNILQAFSINYEEIISNCNSYATNQQIGKNISMTGSTLNGQNLAYPCGQLSMFYPEGSISVRNTDTNQLLTLKTDDLSVSASGFTNYNLAQQWADVESTRYSVWSEANIARGLKKYWGYIEEKVPENIQIVLTTTNALGTDLKNQLKIQVTDNLALSGYNVPLCAFNFIWAFGVLILSAVSFWVVGLGKKKGLEDAEGQSQAEQSIPQYSYAVHS